MNKNLVKQGSMYYNHDKEYVALIINRTERHVEYQWMRVDGKKLQGYMSGAGGKCKVTFPEFKEYIKKGLLKELSPLEKELL